MNRKDVWPGAAIAFGLATVLSVVLFSCQPRKSQPTVEVPQNFSESGDIQTPDRWWESFQDEQLNSVVEQTLSDNLDILSAWDRLNQAQAIYKQSNAPLWPDVSGTLGWSDKKEEGAKKDTTVTIAPGVSINQGGVSEGEQWSLSFTAAYELDLWGRVRSARKGAVKDMQASSEDLMTVALTMSGEVSKLYYQIVEQREQLDILQSQLDTNQTFLELLQLRFNNGLSAAADVLQQKQQVQATEGEMPVARMRLELLEHQLAVMVGKPPKTQVAGEGGQLPELPPLPSTGLPADLLMRRPDVRSAHLRLRAADWRVAEAIANRLPRLSISVSASDQEEEFESLFENWLRNIAVNLTAPIFDAGRRKAEVERTRAVASERLHGFEKTMLTAVQEVEDALVKERMQREILVSLDQQVETARLNVEFSRDRYRNGATDFLPVLIALQTLQHLERAQLEGKRVLLSYRIDLYKALGGGFELEHPAQDTAKGE